MAAQWLTSDSLQFPWQELGPSTIVPCGLLAPVVVGFVVGYSPVSIAIGLVISRLGTVLGLALQVFFINFV